MTIRVTLLAAVAASLLFVPGCGSGGGGDSTGPKNPGIVRSTMSSARAAHTVTTLANGDLLIAGGFGTSGARLATADVFDASALGVSDPVDATGAMTVTRARHTTTLLASGNAVAIGGAPSATTEEYTPNPGTPPLGTWAASGVANLLTPRSRHASIRLLDGRVLVVGGEDAGGFALASVELYVNAASPMVAAAPLATARRDHTATLLLDGRVLVVGGRDAAGSVLASAEVYDPGTNTWTTPVSTLASARALHTALFLDGGDLNPVNDRVMVASGFDLGGAGLEAVELFDPATNTFAAGGDLEGPGVFDAAAVVLANGQAAVVGGFTDGGAIAFDDPVRETNVYRIGSGQGVGAQDIPGRRGALRAATIASTGPAGSDVVVCGGYAGDGTPTADVWVLAIDDETTALADTLTTEEALALGMFATAFHLFDDGLTGPGDVDLSVGTHPVFGRVVSGWVGNFEVFLELDAGSVVGDVEGKPFILAVDGGLVTSPDFLVDFRFPDFVEGDMDAGGEDFDFDVDRAPAFFDGFIEGFDMEADLRVDVDGASTDELNSWLDVYWI